jgi:hypothetical protein
MELTHDDLGIRSWTDANVITFNGMNERLSHSVALRTFDRRGSRFKTDVAGGAAGIANDVAAAIVGQPLDGAND